MYSAELVEIDENYSQLSFQSRIAKLSNGSLSDPLGTSIHTHLETFCVHQCTWNHPHFPPFSHTIHSRDFDLFSWLLSESYLPDPLWRHRINERTAALGESLEACRAQHHWSPLLLTSNSQLHQHISSHVTDRWLRLLIPPPHF